MLLGEGVTERHLASNDPEAIEAVQRALATNGELLVSVRFAGHGSRKEWHLVDSTALLAEVAGGIPGTGLLVFLTRQLPIRGAIDAPFRAAVADLATGHPEILTAVREPGHSPLVDATIFEPVDPAGSAKLTAWLDRHAGEQAVAGSFPAFADDDAVLDLVVPDVDGSAEHGFY